MDYGFPPGGLERLFQQYDHAMHRGVLAARLSKLTQEAPGGPAGQSDEPPWHAPESTAPGPISAPQEKPANASREAAKPTSANAGDWRDPWEHAPVVMGPPKRSRGDDVAAGMEEAQKRLNEDPNGASLAQDEAGLERAYNNATSTGVYYDPETRTEYVKGSKTAREWWDDFTKIPAYGNLQNSERYQQARDAYQKLQDAGNPVDRVVGHSLGGSVALQMQKDLGIPRTRTYGAPVLDLGGSANVVNRFRHPFDPVSMFDFGAKEGNLQLYPHTYGGYAKPAGKPNLNVAKRDVNESAVNVAKREAKPEIKEQVLHIAKPARPARHVLPQASDQNSMVLTA